jgi:hypothetical protein
MRCSLFDRIERRCYSRGRDPAAWCHRVFGAQDEIGFYLFTANAPERMFDALNEHDNGMTLNYFDFYDGESPYEESFEGGGAPGGAATEGRGGRGPRPR